jgi:hypothetical protein
MRQWKQDAYAAIAAADFFDDDYVPEYRVPARRWWQLWKPRWRMVRGVSRAQTRRAQEAVAGLQR